MRVVATAEIPPIGHRLFAPIGEIEQLNGRDGLAEAEVLLLRNQSLTHSDIERATNLRVVARTGSGVDNIDIDSATEHRIPIVFAPGAGARPVAEGALALILAAAKRLGELASIVREDRWGERYGVEGLDLQGAVLGIVGYGEIGRAVGELARALQMRVVAHDPHVPDPAPDGTRMVPLHELAAQCDVLTLHCPLTAATRGMIDADLLGLMKPGSVLINSARGGLIADDQVLLEALRSGQLSSIGLDVYGTEPPAGASPLLRDPRVVCTPHTIGLTREWNARVFQALARDVSRVLGGLQPVNVVNPAVLGDIVREA